MTHPVLKLFARWSVALQKHSTIPFGKRGPSGDIGCDPRKRIVYYLEHHDLSTEVSCVPEYFLHELMHVVCQPPGREIRAVDEAWILMQVERATARAVLNKRDFHKVIDYQHVTVCGVAAVDEELGSVPNYRWRKEWREGFRRARAVGLLDERNRPTFAWPKWEQMPAADLTLSCVSGGSL